MSKYLEREESPKSERERNREEKLKAIGMRNKNPAQEYEFGGLLSHAASTQSQEFQSLNNFPAEIRASDDFPSRFYMMSEEPAPEYAIKSKIITPHIESILFIFLALKGEEMIHSNNQRARSKTPTGQKRNLVLDPSHLSSRQQTETTPRGVSNRGNWTTNHRSVTPKGTRSTSTSFQHNEGSFIQVISSNFRH